MFLCSRLTCAFSRFYFTRDSLPSLQRRFGFFVPDAEYVCDLDGLVRHVAAKVRLGCVCLQCGRAFRTAAAAQQHMVAACHCKLRYEGEDELDELSDFYDFRYVLMLSHSFFYVLTTNFLLVSLSLLYLCTADFCDFSGSYDYVSTAWSGSQLGSHAGGSRAASLAGSLAGSVGGSVAGDEEEEEEEEEDGDGGGGGGGGGGARAGWGIEEGDEEEEDDDDEDEEGGGGRGAGAAAAPAAAVEAQPPLEEAALAALDPEAAEAERRQALLKKAFKAGRRIHRDEDTEQLVLLDGRRLIHRELNKYARQQRCRPDD